MLRCFSKKIYYSLLSKFIRYFIFRILVYSTLISVISINSFLHKMLFDFLYLTIFLLLVKFIFYKKMFLLSFENRLNIDFSEGITEIFLLILPNTI